ncbi:16S rRNA (uracil(1498)-N(3))-methyltransferase [Halobacillus seohaensis]|uniref:Ribosomal RNA small subunit methyltransferase E n=1 Tax=Halobacillus seohaensis TaxID=447421 RepID=A0ABW2EGN4_9BACI
MQRYFVSDSNWDQANVYIIGDDVHHMTNVMRMKEGDTLIAVHPNLGAAICCIKVWESSDRIKCEVIQWVEEKVELPIDVTIVQSIGKGDKLEQVVQKGTELGACAFIPYQADRSVAKWDHKKVDKKLQRLRKIAKEASEQSERVKIPTIHPPLTLSEINNLKSFDRKLMAFENEARYGRGQPLNVELSTIKDGQSAVIAFGPEGGFSEKEAENFQSYEFKPVRLGPRILRMETAPLYFLSAISYEFEEK